MNKGKVGAKYQYPESLISLQAVWHQWVDYRGIEGITRKLVEAAQLPAFNDYSTINRRVNRMDVRFKLPKGSCCVSTDGSGMKFENAGEYRARMYGKRRKYIKVVISADPLKKKMIDCDVSVEGEGH
ncbi:MAG: IS5/IS1182 family transposase, partial [Bacteroidota bacterium]